MTDVTIPGWAFAMAPLALVMAKLVHGAWKADDRYVKRSDFDPRACILRPDCDRRHQGVDVEQARLIRMHEEEREARHTLGNQLQKDLVPRLIRVEEGQKHVLAAIEEIRELVKTLVGRP